MNSRERFLAVLKDEIPDRTPLAHVSALTTIELQEITGCFMPEVHTNAEKLARLCFANHEVLGFDAGKIMGPFSMVQVMHGVEKTMIDMLENPGKIRYFLQVAADILIKCANAQFEGGIDALAIGEGGAGGNMLSPQMYEKFLLPVHKRMIKEIHGPTIMHICGDITSRLHLLSQVGFTCFNFDRAIKPEVMKEISREKFKIMGNINTTDLLLSDTEKIERQVIENLQAGVDIISPGCAVSPKCPNSNFQAIEAIAKTGSFFIATSTNC